jgi:pSer/pThr/pTyr-binding forkhead associated (FHA) protein
MKLKLVVLAGAKEGLEIPLKKEKFLIGRAKECALRAGSEAISRQHCAITRHDNRYTVKDLGSRNGTYVNDKRISEEVPLAAGNELRVGPLKFRIDVIPEKSAKEAAPAKTPAPSDVIVSKDSKPRKQPPVKDVADFVQRTINKSDSTSEDDVSRWLLGVTDTDGPETLKETRSLRAEETRTTMSKVKLTGDSATVEDVSKLMQAGEAAESEEAAPKNGEVATEAEAEEEAGSGVWKWLKRGKGAPAKKPPGMLPPRTDHGATKHRREAAADFLREMQRRR